MKDIRLKGTKALKSMLRKDSPKAGKSYNEDMLENSELMKLGFRRRLSELRIRQNVSAREMSLALGQASGYINSIENGYTLPSLMMLFEICDYLKVSPSEFFEYAENDNDYVYEACLPEIIKGLKPDEREIVRKLVQLFERKGV